MVQKSSWFKKKHINNLRNLDILYKRWMWIQKKKMSVFLLLKIRCLIVPRLILWVRLKAPLKSKQKRSLASLTMSLKVMKKKLIHNHLNLFIHQLFWTKKKDIILKLILLIAIPFLAFTPSQMEVILPTLTKDAIQLMLRHQMINLLN